MSMQAESLEVLEKADVPSSQARQMYASMLGKMAVLLGIAYFFITNIV